MFQSKAGTAVLVFLIAGVAAPVVTPFAQTASTTEAPMQADDDPGGIRQVIRWAQAGLAEMDAAIGVLEENVKTLSGEIRSEAQEELRSLQATRDAYKDEIDRAATSTAAQVQQDTERFKRELSESWDEFEEDVNDYFEEVSANAETRRAVFEAQFAAQQQAFKEQIDELNQSAQTATGEIKARIEERANELKIAAAESGEQLRRLGQATDAAWKQMEQGLRKARDTFRQTLEAE